MTSFCTVATNAPGTGAFHLDGEMMNTRHPRAAAPASMAAHVSLNQSGSGTMITLPGGARLYNMARATDDSFLPKPASLCTCSARPTYSDSELSALGAWVTTASGGGMSDSLNPLLFNARRAAA